MTLKDSVSFSERTDLSHINRTVKIFITSSRFFWLTWRSLTSHESREIDERYTSLRQSGLSHSIMRTSARAPPLWRRVQMWVLCSRGPAGVGTLSVHPRQAPASSPPYPEAQPPWHHTLWLAVLLRGTLEQVLHSLFDPMDKSSEWVHHLK